MLVYARYCSVGTCVSSSRPVSRSVRICCVAFYDRFWHSLAWQVQQADAFLVNTRFQAAGYTLGCATRLSVLGAVADWPVFWDSAKTGNNTGLFASYVETSTSARLRNDDNNGLPFCSCYSRMCGHLYCPRQLRERRTLVLTTAGGPQERAAGFTIVPSSYRRCGAYCQVVDGGDRQRRNFYDHRSGILWP